MRPTKQVGSNLRAVQGASPLAGWTESKKNTLLRSPCAPQLPHSSPQPRAPLVVVYLPSSRQRGASVSRRVPLLLALALLSAASSGHAAELVRGFGGPAGFGDNIVSPNDDRFSDEIDLTGVFP
jgi:hypothetical protein